MREPQVKGQLARVKIPILRVGDTSKVSVVRVHTKDGSATSGEDYNPLSQGERERERLDWGVGSGEVVYGMPKEESQCVGPQGEGICSNV